MNDRIDPIGIAMGLINGRPLTDEVLQEVLDKLIAWEGVFTQEMVDEVRVHLETNIGVTHYVGEVINKEEHVPWVSDYKGSVTWHYWDSYKQYLTSFGRNSDFVRVLDEDTDKILTECGNPNIDGPWRLRGLVMGDVQSGKTANYTGLISKAADAGYRIIILLTGMIEDLRKQTQGRLDEGFVGRSSSDILSRNRNTSPIGAGNYRHRDKAASVLTSVDKDFLTANLQAFGGVPLANMIATEPMLFVLKKNKTTLENICKWLNKEIQPGQTALQWPMLLIDDEADNASVNTKKEDEDPATINRLIKETLSKFSRASYVAYTATPFANVFINPEDTGDLFPSDFIYSLNTPSNYIGASSVFLEDGAHYEQLRDINDAESCFPYRHKKDIPVEDIPDSLRDAIRTFFLSCAVRDLKKEKLRHRSMLINVSLFNDVQAKVADRVRAFSWELKQEIEQYLLSSSWESHADLQHLRDIWLDEYGSLGIKWDDVRGHLHQSVAAIDVLIVNQKASAEQKLNYDHYSKSQMGRRVIAIGGLTLSRGLTLEGLCVSYFYRNSKAYDTLLQMGRWFGYRPGYDDLFRIWMDPDAQDWYAHIATAVNELRTDFRRMSANRMPPSDFGMRVRSHSDTLIITALNKMRNSMAIEHSISFSALGTETAYLPRSGTLHEENVRRVEEFMRSEGQAERVGNRFVWSGVTKSKVAELISDLNISIMNTEFIKESNGQSPLVNFVRNNQYRDLEVWDVCIPQGKGHIVDQLEIPPGNSISCRERQFEKVGAAAPYLKLNRQRVGEWSDEPIGMSKEELTDAEQAWLKEGEKDPKKAGKRMPGYMYRRFRSKPLLTIHFIESVPPSEDSKTKDRMMSPKDVNIPVLIAISLSFPDFDPACSGEKVLYRLNKIAIEEIFGEINDEDED